MPRDDICSLPDDCDWVWGVDNVCGSRYPRDPPTRRAKVAPSMDFGLAYALILALGFSSLS